MKIYGIGTDISNTKRIKISIKKKGFITRVFAPVEIKKCLNKKNNAECFSKRFAAKEAFAKAIGTGIRKGINFKEIVIYNIKSGKPSIKLHGDTKKKATQILKTKKYSIFLSLSDDKPFAIATVIISK